MQLSNPSRCLFSTSADRTFIQDWRNENSVESNRNFRKSLAPLGGNSCSYKNPIHHMNQSFLNIFLPIPIGIQEREKYFISSHTDGFRISLIIIIFFNRITFYGVDFIRQNRRHYNTVIKLVQVK